ncbi:MAG: hypothetical protein ABJ084_12915 [Halioglobus sp.]
MTGLIVAGLLAASGCAKEDPEGVIPEGYKKSMDKAEAVEQQLQDDAAKKLEAIDKQID